MTNRQEDDSKAIPKAQKSVTKDLTFVASPDSALGQIVLDSLCILEVPLGRVARLLDLLWEDDREISHHVCCDRLLDNLRELCSRLSGCRGNCWL